MDLGHRIVAMVGGAPKRVLCLTCNTEHNYRAPKNVKSRDAAVRVRGTRAESVRAPATGGARATAKAKTEAQRYEGWASKTLGKAVDAFTRYSMDRTFKLGELVMHPKFGEGYVEQVLEDGKVSVMFREGAKVLAHLAK
jgi:hypothetical protein